MCNEKNSVGRFLDCVMAKLHDWLATTALAALDKLPQSERGASTLINQVEVLLKQQCKLEQAEPLYIEALDGRRALGNTHPSTLTSINNYAALLEQQGKVEQAKVLYILSSRHWIRMVRELSYTWKYAST